MIRWSVRHFVALAAACGLAGYVYLFARPSADSPIRSDGYNYYVYLPSWLIYQDTSLEALSDDWYGGAYPSFSGIQRFPGSGRWANRHPIGVAVLMLPFFAAADLLTRWSNFPRDGFSFYYQHGAALAGLAYWLAGLALLRRTLSRHFSPGVTLATLVAITWGTNLFHYAVYDGTFSHTFSFALVCALVELSDRWWTAPATLTQAVALGLIAALIVLVRHPNAVLLLIFPCWRVASRSDLTARLADLWKRRSLFAVSGTIALAAVLPQLELNRSISGQWIFNTYAIHGLGFTFLTPHLFGAMISPQRGLFFWSPILLVAVAGMFVARGWAREVRPGIAVVWAANAWIVASWTEWQYGASFGHRAFIDSLALMAPFLAAFFAWTAERRRAVPIVAIGAAAAIALSIAQTIQYWLRIWPARDITWDQYRSLFLIFR